MKRSEAPQVQKVELLCTRITKLCTTNPSLCAQAIQGLSDFILSLEVTLNQQKQTPPSQPSSQQSSRSRAASTGAPKVTRRESNSNLSDSATLNSTESFTPVSTKGRNPSPAPRAQSTVTTDNHPLRNNRRALESTTPPAYSDLSPPFYQAPPTASSSSKPVIAPKVEPETIESIQREYESFNMREKKAGTVLMSDLDDPESNPVMSFANTLNTTTPLTAPSTPLTGTASGNGIARRRSMRIFDSDENEQYEANEKKMMMKRGLDEQIQEKKRLADIQPPGATPTRPSTSTTAPSTPPSNTPQSSITPQPHPSNSSARFPLALQLPHHAPPSSPASPPTNLLYRTNSTFDTDTPSTPTYSPLSTPQYGRFKYSQATPEEKEALNKKFQQQKELQRNLQLQMEEKKNKTQPQTTNFGNTW